MEFTAIITGYDNNAYDNGDGDGDETMMTVMMMMTMMMTMMVMMIVMMMMVMMVMMVMMMMMTTMATVPKERLVTLSLLVYVHVFEKIIIKNVWKF